MSSESLSIDQNNSLNVVSIRLVKNSALYSKNPILSSSDAIELLGMEMSQLDRECVAVISMRSDGAPICVNFCSLGCLNMSVMHPREIFKAAILANAASMILMHNHPSGSVVPSKEDIAVTDRMVQLCGLMGIPLLDHIIVGEGNEDYFSFNEKKCMPAANLVYANKVADIDFEVAIAEPSENMRRRNHR